MKRLIVALLLLAGIFTATLYNARHLSMLTEHLNAQLAQAEISVSTDQWGDAEELTCRAYHDWQAQSLYLHILLRHNDTDDVNIGFEELRALILQQDAADYAAASARLQMKIALLYEAEQLSLRNVL
ncbi:MAG: DUF4363 family protein [Pseudoflavonifractor sp.]